MGHDTVSANTTLGHPPDAREYQMAVKILRDLSITSVRLLTNNPHKLEQLDLHGINVVERLPLIPPHLSSADNSDDLASDGSGNGRSPLAQRTSSSELLAYIETKVKRMGHLL
jgi:GTP cyclohydrolase II